MGDTVFIGSCAGTFYALDKTSGEKRWEYDIRADGKQTSFHGDPLVADDLILVGTDYSCSPDGVGHLYAFNIADGTVRWKYNSLVGLSTNVIRVESNAWVGTVAGDWESVAIRSGRMNAHVPTPTPKGECELPKWLGATGDSVVAVGKDNLIYTLSNRTGRIRWKVKLPGDPSTSPAIRGDEILIGGRDKRVYTLTVRDGKVKSSLPVNGVPIGRALIVADVAVFILDGAKPNHGSVAALGRNGILWSAELAREQSSEQPYAWNGAVVVGDCGGTITALTLDTGKSAWSTSLDGCIRSIGGDKTSLYIGAQQGTVFRLNY